MDELLQQTRGSPHLCPCTSKQLFPYSFWIHKRSYMMSWTATEALGCVCVCAWMSCCSRREAGHTLSPAQAHNNFLIHFGSKSALIWCLGQRLKHWDVCVHGWAAAADKRQWLPCPLHKHIINNCINEKVLWCADVALIGSICWCYAQCWAWSGAIQGASMLACKVLACMLCDKQALSCAYLHCFILMLCDMLCAYLQCSILMLCDMLYTYALW